MSGRRVIVLIDETAPDASDEDIENEIIADCDEDEDEIFDPHWVRP